MFSSSLFRLSTLLLCSLTLASADERDFRVFHRQGTESSTASNPATITLTTSAVPTLTGSLPLSIFPPPPDPTLVLTLNTVPQLTTCGRATFTWVYSGPSGDLELVVTNQDPQITPTPPVSVTESLTFTADALQQNYTWPLVDIPAGTYVLQAIMATAKITRSSTPFSVVNGTSVSCLIGDSFPSPFPSHIPTTPATPSPSAFVAAASNERSVNGGIIAGSIVAALIVLAIAVIIALHNYRRRRAVRSRSSSKFWAALSSKDYSSARPSSSLPAESRNNNNKNTRGNRGSAQSQPHEPFADLHAPPLPMDGHIARISPAASDEDVTIAAPSEEKHSPTHDEHDVGPTLSRRSYSQRTHNRRSSASSNRSYASRLHDANNIPIDALATPPAARRRSGEYRPPPLSYTHAGTTTAPNEYVHGAEMVPIVRSPSVGSSIRRGTRKPVPQYDPTELDDERAARASAGGGGHQRDLDYSDSSFVGKLGDFQKPVHYLMPDLPPPPSPRR